jgi:hypothetical protein
VGVTPTVAVSCASVLDKRHLLRLTEPDSHNRVRLSTLDQLGSPVPNSSRQFLDAAYTRLGFADGDLLSAADEPNDRTSPVWVDKGDWLALAKKVGAEKVFFVDTYPVIVFAEQKTADPAEWFGWFNQPCHGRAAAFQRLQLR